jgi:hypothetical protein
VPLGTLSKNGKVNVRIKIHKFDDLSLYLADKEDMFLGHNSSSIDCKDDEIIQM